jgi:DNA invertase Pin-like site-specific DNA recombinase
MIYGYLRVSSDEQDVNSQKQGVEAFAKEHGWTIDEYISDEGVSGGKDPDKRNLGPLLKKLVKDDIVIASEISRLGRDLYMVMDILHFCMERGVIIHTVKDRFTLGDDIQSKVLAFAFGLAAEIERQMIRQRTKEGLKLRVKMGVLLGRGCFLEQRNEPTCDDATKEKIIEQYNWGVPLRRLAVNFKVDRCTIQRWLHKWKINPLKYIEDEEKRKEQERVLKYKEGDYCAVDVTDKERAAIISLIELDSTLPQIAEHFPHYTYEQLYDTFMCDRQFNALYRQHAQKKLVKKK